MYRLLSPTAKDFNHPPAKPGYGRSFGSLPHSSSTPRFCLPAEWWSFDDAATPADRPLLIGCDHANGHYLSGWSSRSWRPSNAAIA